MLIFKQLYDAHKEGRDPYGCFCDLPGVLLEYFNILDDEIRFHEKIKKQGVLEAQKILDEI